MDKLWIITASIMITWMVIGMPVIGLLHVQFNLLVWILSVMATNIGGTVFMVFMTEMYPDS